jgi:hypothetical protein
MVEWQTMIISLILFLIAAWLAMTATQKFVMRKEA